MEFSAQEISEFKTESFELLDIAENSILAYDSTGDYGTTYNSLFRTFHSLKGSCGMMGLTELQGLFHKVEDILVSTKESQKIDKNQLDVFLQALDKAKELFRNVNCEGVNEAVNPGSGSPPPPAPESVSVPASTELAEATNEFLAEGFEICSRVSTILQNIERGITHENDIDSLYRDIHTLKGSAYLFNVKPLGDLAHAIETNLDPIRENKVSPPAKMLDLLLKSLDVIEKILTHVSEKKPLDFEDAITKIILALQIGAEDSAAQSIASLSTPVKEVTMPQTKVPPPPPTNSSPGPSPIQAPVATSAGEADKDGTSSIRVPVLLLDKLMTLMGEMVLVRNQVIQYSSKTDDLEFLNLSQRLNVVTSEIQGEMMKTRMQPIGNVLGKFTRLVRDLSKELGKKIEIVLSGNETELDKTLLEAVKDPLTHIVRNACDHGIEMPEERRSKGKQDAGTILVKSYHEGGQVIVEVQDDGAGLPKDKIIAKAIEKSIITKEKASSITDREIFQLIFAPGFSTAAKVSNVSGRGVGMDVVKTNIEKIGGTVEISSEPNHGTSIKLKIPLTLAIVPALIVKTANEHFAIPQLKLVELVRVEGNSESQIELIQGNPVFRLRGQILSLLNLNRVLEHPSENGITGTNIIVLKSDNYVFGLIVDEVQDTADIVVKPLSRFLKSISIYSGATVLGDGSVALILDVAGLAKTQLLANQAPGSKEAAKSKDAEGSHKTHSEAQDFLLLRLNTKVRFAILLGYVHRLEEFKTDTLEMTAHRYIVRYRDSVLPLLELNNILGISKADDFLKSDTISVVVIEKAGMLYGLIVDEILDVLKTEKHLDTTVTENNGTIGNLVTENGIITVVDPYRIINTYNGVKDPQLDISIPSVKTPKTVGHANDHLLLVEDSVFFRRQVGKELEKAGYKVSYAKDGQEAITLLESADSQNYSLVLSDIEMPVMNGFQLAEAVRKNAKFKNLPMIALSTRADDKYLRRGLDAGFNIYLEKMNVETLLKSIDQIKIRKAA